MKTALLAGSTGLIGNQLLTLLLESPRYGKVIAISRRPLPLQNDKLINVIADMDSIAVSSDQLVADDIFCCLGTTMKQAKTKEVFMKVDCDYPVDLARLTLRNGAKQFFLVTALGASDYSFIFYNRVKGKVEKEIAQIGFSSYHIFRPSLLLGDRAEQRSGEKTFQGLYKKLDRLIPLKYKGIDSIKVARAMLAYAVAEMSGNHLHESGHLQAF